jgi:hypothetical protein
MKKLVVYLGCLLCMASVLGCSDISPVGGDSNKDAISFDNVQTKAIVSSADDILSMGVLAQMNLGAEEESGYNDYTMILENEHVHRTSPEAAWTYDHTRYWVPDRAFHFFAVWPYSEDSNSSVTNVSASTGNGPYNYNVTYTTPDAADQELLTAVKTETTTETSFPSGVDFEFAHQLTNVHFKIWRDAKDDNEVYGLRDKIRVKQVIISNVTKTATLTTDGLGSSSSWNYASEKMTFTKDYGEEGIDVAAAKLVNGVLTEVDEGKNPEPDPGIPFGDEGLLLIPHTITSTNAVIIRVIYDLQRPIDQGQDEDIWEEGKMLQAFLPEGTWPAGKKVTYNMVISGERTITEFQINTIVEDWNRQTDKIDFSEQVEVREEEKMHWIEGTYESLNEPKGEVVLFTDVGKVATCRFNIRAPKNATWTASLIPLTANAMDAFSIVEDSKYGVVGSDDWQYVKIKINNPDPISAMNACLLRITVTTSDGRSIVVKNLMPKKTQQGIEEFTIIQNLING